MLREKIKILLKRRLDEDDMMKVLKEVRLWILKVAFHLATNIVEELMNADAWNCQSYSTFELVPFLNSLIDIWKFMVGTFI